MLLDIDLATDQITAGPGIKDAIRLIEFKFATTSEISLRFWQAGIRTELATGATGQFAIKPSGEYDGTPLVAAATWTKTGSGTTALYTFTPDFNTVPLAALLFSGDSDVENDVASISAMLEIKWIADAAVHRTQTVTTTIFNDVIKDADGTPLILPTPEDWLEALRPAPIVLPSPPVDGTTAATVLGQLIIVEAADGLDPLLTTQDVWTCVQVTPSIWQPPGDIMRDRTSGTLYRNSVDGGVPSLNLAYD